ncbi:alpha/beta hydrolase family protein [Paenibacillus spongiae]|uniref:Alpha/beta fold hydrolase n=1 Tax=Paenibacillus spongiae TaxID=2909671 RepID=A0ABY5SH52_9BACL|nr:alpha/beta fold hydrolase [Paenibacillus spongiae]UVI33271.1 alpha/beta fold hydrolase [Paenibacillus spongiae]
MTYGNDVRKETAGIRLEWSSSYQDFLYYESSVTPGTLLAMNVIKPEKPSFLLVRLHGWHMSMPEPQKRDSPLPENDYLVVQVDMRGRAYSEGSPDCNGYELVDIYDAVKLVQRHYSEWLVDPAVVFVAGGSGGGGNVLAAINKFPDLFAAAVALYGISDYAEWYATDRIGEFRDDMDAWIGCAPWDEPEPFEARSGACLAENQLTPLLLAHGTFDSRVPVGQSRSYMRAAEKSGKSPLIRYRELIGVGGEEHTDRLTEEELRRLGQEKEDLFQSHAKSIDIPSCGSFVIGGYLYTKQFVIHLDHIDHIARVSYDLGRNQFKVTARRPYPYRILTPDGTVTSGTAETAT